MSKDVLEHLAEEELDRFLRESRRVADNGFHVVPLGNGDGKFVVPDYERDVTHKLRHNAAWWVDKFRAAGWKYVVFSNSMKGIKENWTSRYPTGNGFFRLK
jgi:carbamate kinase